MGILEIHTANGWVKLEDIIPGVEKCDKCGEQEKAEGAGYIKCNPPELRLYFCKECR